jgi:hypothetical protein
MLAICAVAFGLALNALYVFTLARLEMPVLPDFEVYYGAAERVLHGQPLYFGPQLDGPFDIWCQCFLYPPFLAQALVPLTILPLSLAKVVWFALMTAAALASTWLATGIGGASRSIERALWCSAATLLFLRSDPAVLAGPTGKRCGQRQLARCAISDDGRARRCHCRSRSSGGDTCQGRSRSAGSCSLGLWP